MSEDLDFLLGLVTCWATDGRKPEASERNRKPIRFSDSFGLVGLVRFLGFCFFVFKKKSRFENSRKALVLRTSGDLLMFGLTNLSLLGRTSCFSYTSQANS